jgi:DNA-binding PadR family transcriptional regulator
LAKLPAWYNDLDFMNDDRDLYSGMIRLHVLHHAERRTIFGAGMSEELARHGYKINPGTMYPILHGLEKRGYLQSREERSGKSLRRVYRITVSGRRALNGAKLRAGTLRRAD